MRLQILTPAETLLEVEETKWVHLRLADGTGLTVYPGHAPLLAETVTAPLRYVDESGEHAFDVEAGILEVDDQGVMVFTSGKPEAAESLRPSAVAEEKQFERLARELKEKLQTESERLLEGGLDETG
jgi:F0F1-type ATP synthase epsilon subunit